MLQNQSFSSYPNATIGDDHQFLDQLENSQFGGSEKSVSTSESKHMRQIYTATVTTKSLFFCHAMQGQNGLPMSPDNEIFKQLCFTVG